jgi:hypothetical protein
MKTVMQEQDSRSEGLPRRVQEALGELAGAAKEGLLALSVGVELGVLSEMMEAELDEVVREARDRDGAHRCPSRPRRRTGHARWPPGCGEASASPHR